MAKFHVLYEAVRLQDCARLRQLVRGGIDVDSRDSMKRTVLHHAAVHLWEEYMYTKDQIQILVDLGADINAADLSRRTPLHYYLSEGADKFRRTMIRSEIKNQQTMRQLTREEQTAKLEEAITRIRISAVEYLVGLGADINARFDHVTSLHRAIQLDNIRGIETLLKLGVDVNACKAVNWTALYLALGLPTLLKGLVALGADVNSSCSMIPPLLEAVEQGRMDIIKLLIQHGADFNVFRLDNNTPVIAATDLRLPDAVKILAQLGADLNTKHYKSIAMNEIVRVGRVDILEYFVRHGAKFLPLGSCRLTALGIAVSKDFDKMFDCLVKAGTDLKAKQYKSTATNEIVRVGKVDILKYFVRHGANFGMAVSKDFDKMVDCLVKAGADVNARYDERISPLVTAMRLGDTDMVKALAKLEPYQINLGFLIENTTAVHHACNCNIKTMELLLKYGGDVNLKYDYGVLPVHEAVAQGDGEMLRVLAELGADLNSPKVVGADLVHCALKANGTQDQDNTMAMIKLLVGAGLDLNQPYNVDVTPLHDAVRLQDTNVVQILSELKADMNAKRIESITSLFIAITQGRIDVVRYCAENVDCVNSRVLVNNVSPLHDAVRQGNVNMVHVLIKSGADIKYVANETTALTHAINMENDEMVKCLLECGADINRIVSQHISLLHDAVENSDLENSDLAMIHALLSYKDLDVEMQVRQFSPLHFSIHKDHSDITETLLKHGADLNSSQGIFITPLDVALDQYKVECALLLMSQNMRAYGGKIGSSPLHLACISGHIDLARLLIVEGSDVNKQDYYGKNPLERLPLADTADYHVLQETVTAARVTDQVPPSFVSTSGCQDMATALHTPGIGDVRFISSPSATEISERVNKLITSIVQQPKEFSKGRVQPVGSSAEGTRVGLPNEMDFLFRLQLAKDEEMKVVDSGNGYTKYGFVREDMKRIQQQLKHILGDEPIGSAEFHTYFNQYMMDEHFVNTQNAVSDEKVSVYLKGTPGVRNTNRKACSLLRSIWNDGKLSFTIPVDIVPSLHINNWPEGATTRTWLMNEQELRSRGYVLVPKPPHAKSDLAKECTDEELQTLWKISFPHLETEHMQRLEPRVKDVYSTAKCLRNPDVCRIMITDDGSLPKTVGKYITSYQLKMCFFKNVDYFRQHDELCLEEMVCKVYNDLVLGLSKNFIPLFFLPNVSALSGIKIDVPKCVKVAKIMARFVRALYLRDYLGDITDGGDDMVLTVYQRNPSSVYRICDISEEDV